MCETICMTCETCRDEGENNGCTGQTGGFYSEACPNCKEYKGARVE